MGPTVSKRQTWAQKSALGASLALEESLNLSFDLFVHL